MLIFLVVFLKLLQSVLSVMVAIAAEGLEESVGWASVVVWGPIAFSSYSWIQLGVIDFNIGLSPTFPCKFGVDRNQRQVCIWERRSSVEPWTFSRCRLAETEKEHAWWMISIQRETLFLWHNDSESKNAYSSYGELDLMNKEIIRLYSN